MIIVALNYLKLTREILLDKLFQLSFFEYMIVSMINRSLFGFILNRCLYKGRVSTTFWFFQFLLGNRCRLLFFLILLCLFFGLLLLTFRCQYWGKRLFFLSFFILILQMPCHKDILCFEHFLLLLISPYINEYLSSDLKYPMHFSDCRCS